MRAATDRQNIAREAQMRWLARLLDHVQQTDPRASYSSLARDADLNANTLTRFLSAAGGGGTLSTRTIGALSAHHGFPAPGLGLGDEAAALPPGLREDEATPFAYQEADPLAATVRSIVATRPHAAPFVLRSRALEHEGYRPGDILIVDLNEAPKPGDVVCVQIFDAQSGRAETAFRLYAPPYILACGPVEDARRPRLIGVDTSFVLRGVVVASLRRRPGAH